MSLLNSIKNLGNQNQTLVLDQDSYAPSVKQASMFHSLGRKLIVGSSLQKDERLVAALKNAISSDPKYCDVKTLGSDLIDLLAKKGPLQSRDLKDVITYLDSLSGREEQEKKATMNTAAKVSSYISKDIKELSIEQKDAISSAVSLEVKKLVAATDDLLLFDVSKAADTVLDKINTVFKKIEDTNLSVSQQNEVLTLATEIDLNEMEVEAFVNHLHKMNIDVSENAGARFRELSTTGFMSSLPKEGKEALLEKLNSSDILLKTKFSLSESVGANPALGANLKLLRENLASNLGVPLTYEQRFPEIVSENILTATNIRTADDMISGSKIDIPNKREGNLNASSQEAFKAWVTDGMLIAMKSGLTNEKTQFQNDIERQFTIMLPNGQRGSKNFQEARNEIAQFVTKNPEARFDRLSKEDGIKTNVLISILTQSLQNGTTRALDNVVAKEAIFPSGRGASKANTISKDQAHITMLENGNVRIDGYTRSPLSTLSFIPAKPEKNKTIPLKYDESYLDGVYSIEIQANELERLSTLDWDKFLTYKKGDPVREEYRINFESNVKSHMHAVIE